LQRNAIELLAEIVVDVQEPPEEVFNRYGVEVDERRGSWYWDTDNSEDEDEIMKWVRLR